MGVPGNSGEGDGVASPRRNGQRQGNPPCRIVSPVARCGVLGQGQGRLGVPSPHSGRTPLFPSGIGSFLGGAALRAPEQKCFLPFLPPSRPPRPTHTVRGPVRADQYTPHLNGAGSMPRNEVRVPLPSTDPGRAGRVSVPRVGSSIRIRGEGFFFFRTERCPGVPSAHTRSPKPPPRALPRQVLGSGKRRGM